MQVRVGVNRRQAELKNVEISHNMSGMQRRAESRLQSTKTRPRRRAMKRNKKITQKRTRVGDRDLVGLVGVQPHLALAALEDRGGEALLELERHLQSDRGAGGKALVSTARIR